VLFVFGWQAASIGAVAACILCDWQAERKDW
jgi:hypothetical protein